MIGTKPVGEIAQELNTSVSNIKRAFVGKSIWFQNGKYKNRPSLVRQVINYYETHGKLATVKAFPSVNVKCIIDRPNYYGIKMRPRQLRWTDQQIIELARMGGLISPARQARYFNRPRANAGSIKSAWTKKFGCMGGSINGMSEWMAREIITDECPRVSTEFYESRREGAFYSRKLCIWVDMERHLRTETPDFIADAIRALADFQRWLHQRKPKASIKRIITERGRREIETLLKEAESAP